jgi:4-hydroxybenzoate polyprenyltransferase
MRRLVTVLRFVRFPLVWTALADVLAGAAIASGRPGAFLTVDILPLLVISPSLYLFGMGMNDLVDLRQDTAARSDRPLARGQTAGITVYGAVMIVAVLLGLASVGAAFVDRPTLAMVVLTFAAIVIYNALAKRFTVTAVVFMAACRVCNALIGWSAVAGHWQFHRGPRAPYVWALLACLAGLTALASLFSALEKRHGLKSVAGLRPSSVVLACLLLLPVVDAVCVAGSWAWSPWAAAWLGATALCWLSGALLRRRRPA